MEDARAVGKRLYAVGYQGLVVEFPRLARWHSVDAQHAVGGRIALDEDQVGYKANVDVAVIVAVAHIGSRLDVAADILKRRPVIVDAVSIDLGGRPDFKAIGLPLLNSIGGVDQPAEVQRVVAAVFIYTPDTALQCIGFDPNYRRLKAQPYYVAGVVSVTCVRPDGKVDTAVIPESGPVIVNAVGVDLSICPNLKAVRAKLLDAV